MQKQECLQHEKYKKLLEEVNTLKEEKEQQQKLLAQSLLLPEDARIEASLKSVIARLTNENLVGSLTGYADSLPLHYLHITNHKINSSTV